MVPLLFKNHYFIGQNLRLCHWREKLHVLVGFFTNRNDILTVGHTTLDAFREY